MQNPKSGDVKTGDILIATGSFDCIKPDAKLEVKSWVDGRPYVVCKEGKHMLVSPERTERTLFGFVRP